METSEIPLATERLITFFLQIARPVTRENLKDHSLLLHRRLRRTCTSRAAFVRVEEVNCRPRLDPRGAESWLGIPRERPKYLATMSDFGNDVSGGVSCAFPTRLLCSRHH